MRHYSTHAAGVIITDKPLVRICPLAMRGGADPMVLSQWDMEDVVERGLLKVDLLGLKTLTVIKNALRMIKKNHKKKIVLNKLTLKDEKTFKSFRSGSTIGVFQFENPRFSRFVKEDKT